MEAQVGHLAVPACEPAVELLPGGEAPARQGVALDILDAALDLALGAGAVGLAGVWGEAVIVREVLKQWMPYHPVLTAAQHQGARVIVEAAERYAAKVAKGTLMAVEQTRRLFITIGVSKPR